MNVGSHFWSVHIGEIHRQKSFPGLHSATTGPIITIQKPLESSRAVGVHWLCHLPDFRFRNARNCPKLPDRPPPKILSGLTLGNYWPDYHDSKTTWKLSGCRCALAMSFARFPISKCPKLPKTARSATAKNLVRAYTRQLLARLSRFKNHLKALGL